MPPLQISRTAWKKFVKKPFNYKQITLRKKCPYSELFWSTFFPHFSHIPTMRRKMRTRVTPNKDTFYAVSDQSRDRPVWMFLNTV